jgi:MYXO-CTERM domain-containing protein
MSLTWRGGLVTALCVVIAACISACSPTGEVVDWIRRPLGAICKVNVTGVGVRQVETDYIPHVVACENGGASTEALKAQAVAARSYMYYSVLKSGSICDGTKCQVYSCSKKPQQKHYDAAKATAGQVLVWGGVVVCSFYVAGAKPSTPTCQALASDPDPTNTEKHVTYNEGKSGGGITQTALGWVSPTNKYNRGCKSQNGAHCLASKGKLYPQILRFYYGADIQLVSATGSCVTPPKDASPASDAAPKLDNNSLPKQDTHPPHKLDSSGPLFDGNPPHTGDGLPPVHTPGDPDGQSSGCGVAANAEVPSSGLILLLALLSLCLWRRRTPERPIVS